MAQAWEQGYAFHIILVSDYLSIYIVIVSMFSRYVHFHGFGQHKKLGLQILGGPRCIRYTQ